MRLGHRAFRDELRNFSDEDIMWTAVAILNQEPSGDPAEERNRRATLAEARRRGLERRVRELARGITAGEIPFPTIPGLPASDPGKGGGAPARAKGSRG